MDWFVFFTLLMIATQISSVDAMTSNSDVIGMAVAGCVSFVLFSVVIAFIVITFHWKNWFDGWMRLRGKVRMPRAYFYKKEDAKRRLITTTPVSKSFVGLPDPSIYETVPDVKEWTEGSRHMTPYLVYEDKDATIELEDEDDEIFTIETEVMDDEAPKNSHVSVTNQPTVDYTLEDDDEEHTYCTADSFKKIRQAEEDLRRADSRDPLTSDAFPPSEEEAAQADDEHNTDNNVRITAF